MGKPSLSSVVGNATLPCKGDQFMDGTCHFLNATDLSEPSFSLRNQVDNGRTIELYMAQQARRNRDCIVSHFD